MKDSWPRIAAFHVLKDGTIAAVWIARDPDTDVTHLYDACEFKREVLAVVAEGMRARGNWIPIAWTDEETAMAFRERGCRIRPEPVSSTDSMIELAARDVLERMRTGRFKVDSRLKNWIDEFETFSHEDSRVPKDTHPLMSATLSAVLSLRYARALQSGRPQVSAKRKMAII